MWQLLTRGIGTGAQLATLSFSRSQETQADDLGINYLAGAIYDPTALSTMLKDLTAQNVLSQQIAGLQARFQLGQVHTPILRRACVERSSKRFK